MRDGRLDIKLLLTGKYYYSASINTFDHATHIPPTSVKVQIELVQ